MFIYSLCFLVSTLKKTIRDSKSAGAMNLFSLALLICFCTLARSASPEDRASIKLSEMTLIEKLDMMHGVNGVYIGNIPANERLSIPAIAMHDGPQGFRVTETTGQQGSTTAWPSSITVAASWDIELGY